MILPNVRASFGRAEANLIIGLLTRDDGDARLREEERIRDVGFDALLDDPRTLNVLLSGPGISSASPSLVFYLLVRHMLLESGFHDRTVADYLAAMLIDFGRGNRAYIVQEQDETEHFYLADLLTEAGTADARRAFFIKVHLGDFALWQCGLFPDRITARVERRGAPGINYYEQLGATGYRLAARTEHAARHGLDGLYRTCADAFPELRIALNRLSDRYLFPLSGDPVDRVLRQVADGMRARFKDN